jgi:hypothetical protein
MSQINQMDLSVQKRLLNISLAYRSIKIWAARVKDNFNWHEFQLFPIKKATCDIGASVK